MVLSFSPSHSELKALLLRRFWTRMLYGAAWLVLFPVPGCLVWHFLILSGHWYCFACSFSSGDSGVFLMKKTPFYRVMRHKWRRKSLFTATRKDCHLLHPNY